MLYLMAVLSVSSLWSTWNANGCRHGVVDSRRGLKWTFVGRPVWLMVLLLLRWWIRDRVIGDGRDIFHGCALCILTVRRLEWQQLSISGCRLLARPETDIREASSLAVGAAPSVEIEP